MNLSRTTEKEYWYGCSREDYNVLYVLVEKYTIVIGLDYLPISKCTANNGHKTSTAAKFYIEIETIENILGTK